MSADIDMAHYSRKPFWDRALPYLIIAPALLLTIGILVPFVTAIYYSLTNFSFLRNTYRFIWFRNWTRMFASGEFWDSVWDSAGMTFWSPAFAVILGLAIGMVYAGKSSRSAWTALIFAFLFAWLHNWIVAFGNGEFWHAAWVTAKYAFWSTGMEMALGLGIGLLICKRTNWFTSTLRVVLVFPLMIAPVIATLIWQLMTNTSVGILEKFLNLFGVFGFPWAASQTTALFTAVLIDVWVNTPFIIVLVVAGINSLPKSPFEAAQVDGASAWFTFKNLTMPMLKPFLYIALIFRLMAAMQEYAIIYALTKGGPGDTLMNLSLTAYNKGFYYKRFAEGVPYILFLWLIIFFISKKLVANWLQVQKTASGR
ncbi:MAG: sugar ABC transporter permease [Planctomycetota bacterium]|nr:sugar ABC transporter permease [Planctomycetota bacterium]